MFTRQVGVGEQFGFDMFPHPGPFRRSYDSGIRFAIGMLWESKQPGQHELTMKFSSCRKVCSLHYNMYNASVAGVTVTMVWCSKWQHFVTTTLASDSEFASHFIIGCRASMGEKVNLDTAISICQMLALQALFQREYEEAVSEGDLTEQRRVCEIAVFFLICYCCSMRGFEGQRLCCAPCSIRYSWNHWRTHWPMWGFPSEVGLKPNPKRFQIYSFLWYHIQLPGSSLVFGSAI
jgi:hypothetical protein